MLAFYALDCHGGLCCGSNGICLCMFCVLPVNGIRLYCLYMICYLCGVYLSLFYTYILYLSVLCWVWNQLVMG